jgi:hypothetical protein
MYCYKRFQKISVIERVDYHTPVKKSSIKQSQSSGSKNDCDIISINSSNIFSLIIIIIIAVLSILKG